jgi:hypothetical protein
MYWNRLRILKSNLKVDLFNFLNATFRAAIIFNEHTLFKTKLLKKQANKIDSGQRIDPYLFLGPCLKIVHLREIHISRRSCLFLHFSDVWSISMVKFLSKHVGT